MKIQNPNVKIQINLLNSKHNFLKFVMGILLVICHLSFVILNGLAFAQDKPAAQQEYLSKGEAVEMLSASDVVKKKITELLSWTIGYDLSKVKRAGLTPSIKYISVVPKKIPPDGRTIFEILASVDDPGGKENIAGVRADLTPIGRLSNTVLLDSGLYGDKEARDGIYTLQTSVSQKTNLGEKEIQLSAVNKTGWLALTKTTLDVDKNPAIIGVKFNPEKARVRDETVIGLEVEVENPGKIEDLTVSANLWSFGYKELFFLRNDGEGGDGVAGDNLFALQFIVPKHIGEGKYSIKVEARNELSGYSYKRVFLEVVK